MPHMDDPIFTKSLIYMCENNSEGSLGIIINKPIVSKNAADIIQQTGLEKIKLTSFEDGVKYMEFTEAVTRSAQAGQIVSLPL